MYDLCVFLSDATCTTTKKHSTTARGPRGFSADEVEFSPVPVGVRLGTGHEENVDRSGERLDCFLVDPLLKRGVVDSRF